jgi:hypothetical protein
VTIPNSVTSIGYGAFSGCTSLASVTIPSSVTSIEGEVFYECTSLASVTIPSSVTSIGEWTFSGCTSLASVTIPSSVTSIEDGAFSGCTLLSNAYFAGNAPYYGRVFIFNHVAQDFKIYYKTTSFGFTTPTWKGYPCYPSIAFYSVTFNGGINGLIQGAALQTVNHGGSTHEVTAVPSTGYRFVNWTGDYTGTENPLTLTNISANKTITANFAVNQVLTTAIRSISRTSVSIAVTPPAGTSAWGGRGKYPGWSDSVRNYRFKRELEFNHTEDNLVLYRCHGINS